MTHTMYINGDKHRLTIRHATPLNVILSRYAAYITSIPHIHHEDSMLWVLLDEENPVNAFAHIVGVQMPHSIMSIEHAMTYPYFQRCAEILQTNGMHICDENIGLLVFTLFSWLKQHSAGLPHDAAYSYRNALTIMRHYPEYFSQPKIFTKTYYEIIKRAEEEPMLNIDTALAIQ